jgi:hypothetical protein
MAVPERPAYAKIFNLLNLLVFYIAMILVWGLEMILLDIFFAVGQRGGAKMGIFYAAPHHISMPYSFILF